MFATKIHLDDSGICLGVALAHEARAYCHPAVGGAPLTACGRCGIAAAAAAAAYA